MTNEEYIKAKEDIITQYGKPEWDNFEPVNESAKKLKELRHKRASDSRAENKLKEAAEIAISDSVIKHSRSIPIELTEQDLAPFDEKEKLILQAYFDNMNLTAKQLAKLCGCQVQKVASLWRSGPFLVLFERAFNYCAPMEVKAAILKGIRAGNTQITLRVAEHYSILKAEEIKITKPIEDIEALKRLKEIGDDASNTGV